MFATNSVIKSNRKDKSHPMITYRNNIGTFHKEKEKHENFEITATMIN